MSTADEVRRKILKSGAALVPLAITIQSGTAWAASFCIDGMPLPTDGQIIKMLQDPVNRADIVDHTSMTMDDIDDMLDPSYGHLVNRFGRGTVYDVDEGLPVRAPEVLWMRFNGGASCWVSFCDERILFSPDTGGITGKHSDKVCG